MYKTEFLNARKANIQIQISYIKYICYNYNNKSENIDTRVAKLLQSKLLLVAELHSCREHRHLIGVSEQ